MKFFVTISLMAVLWISGCATSPYRNQVLSKPMRLHEMLASQAVDRALSLVAARELGEARKEVFDVIKRYPKTRAAEKAVMLMMDWMLEVGEESEAYTFGWEFLVNNASSQYTELLRNRLAHLKKNLKKLEVMPGSDIWEGVHTVHVEATENEASEEISAANIELLAPPKSDQLVASVPVLSSGSVEHLDPYTIGVLLPLSGKYAAYGRKALTALRLGLGLKDFSLPKESYFEEAADSFRVIFADTAGDPIQAAKATNHLVSHYGAIALLGDILQDTSVAIAERSEAYGVPLLALSRKENLTLIGSWVFRLGLTVDKQVRGLLEYAMLDRGLEAFAVLYPRHAYGEEMAASFVRHASHLNADIAFVESYDPEQTTFTDLAKRVTGRAELKQDDVYQLCVDEAKLIENKRSSRWNRQQCAKLIPPKVPYRALFVPDFPKTISYLVPALVASDLLVSQDPNIQRIYQVSTNYQKVPPVQLLGSATWNSPVVATRLGKQANGATFVDGFDVGSKLPDVQKFVGNFSGIMSIKPELIEAQAYDGGRIFSFLLSQSPGYRPKTRAAFKSSLEHVEGFPGVVGPISFDSKGDSVVPLFKFELENGQINLKRDQSSRQDS